MSTAFSGRAETLVDHFRAGFNNRPNEQTYRFLDDGEGEPTALSNAEFDRRARAIAVAMRERVPPGERALIICPPGIDYVASFFACLYAGVIAVPVYPPNPALLKRTLPRLIGVVADAQPAVVLAPTSIVGLADQIAEISPALNTITWLAVDAVDDALAQQWRDPGTRNDDVAFLQYTSGSTGQPKGVMVSHGNLLHNLRETNRMFIGDMDAHLVVWLPPYHDMGLIGGLLQPAYGSFPVTFMSPLAFLKRPGRWLRAISKYRATISGGPNFAYDLCVAKMSDEERETLDLSSWELAFNGAEPVRTETLERFARTFAPYGFRRTALYPCYGLAEATLMVTGGERGVAPAIRTLNADALAANTAVDAAPGTDTRSLVSCGKSIPDQVVAIVDAQTRTRLPDGQVGEIWVRGASVARGYWRREEETEYAFGARLADSGEGPFLRTGDLGFLDEGELYVTGRLKDVIIVAGQNHYPQDIERSVETCHPALRPGCGVAFAVPGDDTDRLVIVHEVTGNARSLDAEQVLSAVRAAVAEGHGLTVHDIVLVRQGNVPKTSSGKLERGTCRKAFQNGTLEVIARWSAPSTAAGGTTHAGHEPSATESPEPAHRVDAAPAVDVDDAARRRAAEGRRVEIEHRLREEIAARLAVAPETIDPTQPVATFGLQSADMVGLVGDLERWLGRHLPATLVWEYPTVEALAEHLSTTAPAGPPPAGATSVGVTSAGLSNGATATIPTATTPASGAPAGVAPAGAGAAGTAAGGADAVAAGAGDTSVAIIGIGCRFPGGVDSPEAYWKLLCDGVDAITEVPADRWPAADFLSDDPAAPGRTTTRWGGFLDRVDGFDPHFFGISPHEAARMDPQQRLLAEVAWEALEDAGMAADQLAGSPTGVFVGIATNDYGQRQIQDLDRIDAYTGTGNAFSIAANRLSYLLDLRGPSIAIDTACSSSLVAVHQACQSIARGDCTLAIAGGVNVVLSPALAINFSKAGAMAPDGRCKAFDARANGYVRAEGAGLVVLKPLAAAIADRDPIYGVIRGGAVNQDGRTNGLMAPNPRAQEEVLRAAYRRAGVAPAEVRYVEAHGTGTLLGDPIEAKALSAVLGEGRDPADPCLIGSVKSNIGHLEAAAGVAGLIKAALVLRHRRIPPSLHFERPNPHIPFDSLAVRVVDTLRPLTTNGGPAVVGVSSFGFGGTNAHLVLAEAPPVAQWQPGPAARAHVLTISAHDEAALRDLVARYDSHLARPDHAFTAEELSLASTVRRTHLEHRLACVGRSVADFREALRAFAAGQERPGLSAGGRRIARRPRTVFLFAGQGPRWWPAGVDLIDSEPVFRQTLERADALLRPHLDASLLDLLTGLGDDGRFADPAVAQPALCALQVALAALWRSWGIEPGVVVGHSVGEVAAAHVAGALDLESALLVALHRGRVIRPAIGQGRMALLGVDHERAERLLAERNISTVSIAASNGPTATVLSGEPTALRKLVEELTAEGLFCRELESVDFASHSPQMDAPAAELRTLLGAVRPTPATVPMISTVTGQGIDGVRLDAAYWAANLRNPVLFDQAVTGLVEAGFDTFVEISPHPSFTAAVSERLTDQERDGVVVGSLRRDESARAAMLGALGNLYTAGYPVDWRRLHPAAGPMVDLPRYPWQRQRYWLDDDGPGTAVAGVRPRRPARGGHPALETYVRSATEPRAHHWSARVDLAGFDYLTDHRVADAPVLPAAFVLDAALAAARQALGEPAAIVEEVRLTRMTVVPPEAADDTLQLVLLPETGTTGSFRLFNRAPEAQDWEQVADGRYRVPPSGAAQDTDLAGGDLTEVRARCAQPVARDGYYATLDAAGLHYGPRFQGIEALWRGEREALARLGTPPDLVADAYLLHPALLDSCLQALAAAVGAGSGPDDPAGSGPYLPVGVGRFSLTAGATAPRWAYATVTATEAGQIDGGRVVLFDEAGRLVGEVGGITLRGLEPAGPADPVGDALFDLRWQEVADEPGTATPPADSGWWLLFADAGGVADRLGVELAARGAHPVTVRPGDGFRRVADGRYEIDPARAEDVTALLADLRDRRPGRCSGVVHAWALDAALPEPGHAAPSADSGSDAGSDADADATLGLWRAQDLTGVSALHLIQAVVRDAGVGSPRLLLLTRGAQRVREQDPPLAVAQAPLWGVARVVALEHAELRPAIVDLDPADAAPTIAGPTDLGPAATDPAGVDPTTADGTGLLDLLLRTEGEAALRAGRRYVPRLAPWRPDEGTDTPWRHRPFAPERDGNLRILATEPGILGSLSPMVWHRVPPGPGQVEIEVTAAGLNFSDVLKAMDICPGVPPGRTPLGAECAGRVVAVGEGVTRFRVGDPVMAVAPSSMANYTTTTAELVAPRPAGLDDAQAAAVPIAFLTAVYGLEYLAHLGPGETVLIHSATGGVGLAALQVARRNGAEVLATAGTEAKRDLLRSLGVKHVMDSRSLRFADEVMEITGGRGVDVVLNSLTGEALTRSLALLAPNGRFVEIGKQDIYGNSHLGLEALKHNRSFLAVDLERTFAERPALVAHLFDQVLAGFADGGFSALPVTRFGYPDASAAFSHMAQARHTGKIVLEPTGAETVAERPGDRPVRGNATYLISGGLGGLGLETARYLVDNGARHLVLLGRRGPSAQAERILAELRAGGVEIAVRSLDVADHEQVTALLAELDATMPPLAGVVHAAGVLDDGLLLQLDRARFRSVAAPKLVGAWHLHQATLDRQLDFFVLYSSAAALLGSPGQANYAAANAFLDALAEHRRALGQPALSVNWGPWSEVGLAARPDRGGALSTRGILSIAPHEGIAALDRLIRTPAAQVCVLPLDRDALRDAAAGGLLPALLAGLADGSAASTARADRESSTVRQEMLAVEPGRRRRQILIRHCRAEAARVLKLDESRVDTTTPLAGMGFDSLMALELRKRLETSLRVELPATIVWRFPTIDAMVPFLAERMDVPLDPEPAAAPTANPTAPAVTEADLDRLSDSEVEALLLAKMTQFDEGR